MLRRIRTDWPVVAAAWLLLLCATTLLTAGTLYGDAVALGGLRAAMAQAAPADRAIVVTSGTRPENAEAFDAGIRSELERVIALTGGEVARIGMAGSFADAGTPAGDVTELVEVGAYEGIDRHATLLDGRWAQAGATPQEATVSEAAAQVLGLSTGDTIALVNRRDPSIAMDVAIVGTWQADPDDAYWLDPDLELGGAVERGSFTTVGPLVIPEADLLDRAFGERLGFEWRALPDPAGFQVDNVVAVRTAAEEVQLRIRGALPAGGQFQVESGLPDILGTVDRAALVSRTGVLLLVVQFAVLAAYAIVLVAGMLADRRRAETALLRSRGASSGHLAAMALVEAILLTGLAAALAPAVSLLVVRWLGSTGPLAESGVTATIGLSRDAIAVDLVTAAVCVVALTLPMLGGGPNLAGVRAAIARQAGRTLAQRLGLDIALVVVAAIALWQLRLYGAPLTRNARGVLGVDPLLVAAPGIGLLAGAVVATRLIPRIAEIGQSLLERGRGLVAPMGGRGMARRPLRYTRSALLLMLAAALGTFATAHVATWSRSQGDQAAYQAGADIRLTTSQRAAPARTLAGAFAGIEGVTGVMPVDRVTVDAGRGVRGGPVLAIDADVAPEIVNATPDADGQALPSLFGELAAGRTEAIGAEIPAEATQLGIVVDTAFTSETFDATVPATDMSQWDGLSASLVLEDGLGRLYRLTSLGSAVLDGDGQRLDFDLRRTVAGEAPFTGPLRVRAIELALTAPIPEVVTGSMDLVGIETQAGGAWTPVALGPTDRGWRWQVIYGGSQPAPYDSPDEAPWQILVGLGEGTAEPVFGASLTSWSVRLMSEPTALTTMPVIASRTFAEAVAAGVGDTVSTTIGGLRQAVRIVGVVETFPTLDPAEPFLVVDQRTLVVARFAATAAVADPSEWWLAAGDDAAAVEAIRAGPDPDAEIVTTSARTQELATDPVPLGVIGVLGLGSVAAMIFASIGFIVSATVSTRERLGEFALLRALGLSGRQLSVWLSLENAFLLVIGIAAGIGLGLLLAWLVLPFSTLTSSGAIAVPPPVVVVPWQTLAPIVGVAAAVFVVTLVVLRGQLLDIRIGDVLRGRDE